MSEIRQKVVDAIVQWTLALERPAGRSRINRRILFGDESIADAVADHLRRESTDACAYVVQRSTDDDAVLLRNARPGWASTHASIIYLVFWLPGHSGHERNYESLRDFPPVSLADFLSNTAEFVLPGEVAIQERVFDAATAWGARNQVRAADHLGAAWYALRKCLRERSGGRDRSIPFFDDLESYLEFLDHAHLPDATWGRIPLERRPAELVAAWGRALPRISMFRLPAMGSLLGIHTDPAQSIPSAARTGERKWDAVLNEILAENKEVATDFAGLEEDIAGKQTLRERLGDLTKRIPLCEEVADLERARAALERFCQSGDPGAFEHVDWEFLTDATNRRSASLGLRGLLIARRLRAPRENPLERLVRQTIELLEQLGSDADKESGSVRAWIAEVRAGASAPDRRSALEAADALLALASGTMPQGSVGKPWAQAFSNSLGSPARNPSELERLARGWERYGRPDGSAPVKADNLLFGLVQLCLSKLREESSNDGMQRFATEGRSGGVLVLSTQVEGQETSHEMEIDDWSPLSRDRLGCWLRDKVRPLHFDDQWGESGNEADDDDEEGVSITIDVEWRSGPSKKVIGAIELALDRDRASFLQRRGPEALCSYRREGFFTGRRALSEIFGSVSVEKKAEDPRDEELHGAWMVWQQEIGWQPGCAAIAAVSPVSTLARGWVDAWARAVIAATAGAGFDGELERLEALIENELDNAKLRALIDRKKLLKSQMPSGPKYDVESVRSLLRLCTGVVDIDGRTTQLFLTPQHPLVVRLMLVGDDILAGTLRQLWNSGWDKRGLDDLEAALDEWGLPEPLHCYGCSSGDPLVFEDWLHSGFALFSPLGSNRSVDSSRLGVKHVAGELTRYQQLFPAAADRLRLRLRGDDEGAWAWDVLRAAIESTRDLHADVDLASDLPARQPNRIDRAAAADEIEGRAFEPTPEGGLPLIQIRRRPTSGPTSGGQVHVAAVVGDLIDAFRPRITLMAAAEDPAALDFYDPRLFFLEPVPDLVDYALLIGDPPDRLSTAVGRLIAQAASHPGQAFKEVYSFDPDRNRHELQALQAGSHWLVLTSRQPLYRAVQQCGTAQLLDFQSTIERGRPVHTCVSLTREQADQDIGRLALSIGSLIAEPIGVDIARGVLDAARTLAPGLAMQCIGATGGTRLSGLLGLLLSASRSRSTDGLVLSLDQHRHLLDGSGQLSDLLRVGLQEGTLQIEVIEAKFSTGAIGAGSAVLADAERQVESTLKRLEQFTLKHPLVLRTRARLARAIVQRIHLGAPAAGQAERWGKLVAAALDPDVPIRIATAATGAIQAWSVARDGVDLEMSTIGGKAVSVHGRASTIDGIRALGS